MKSTHSGHHLVLALLAILLARHESLVRAAPQPDNTKDRLREGRDLFLREWRQDDKRSLAGDGLGPVYNARSCLGCHYQAGIGGSGPGDTNVILISAFIDRPLQREFPEMNDVVSQADSTIRQPDREKLAKVYPSLRSENTFLLYRFSKDQKLESWKSKHLNSRVNSSVGRLISVDGVGVALKATSCNPPALLGVGLIEGIPDRVLHAVAAEQAKIWADPSIFEKPSSVISKNNPYMIIGGGYSNPNQEQPLPIRGRVARLANGKIGRFGWKNSMSSVREFALHDCAIQIGLEVPGFPHAAHPWIESNKSSGLDLSLDQCNLLAEFVSSLPRPIEREQKAPAQSARVKAGRQLFDSLGCAECHRPDLGEVKGLYSDLLLHDMGRSLSDYGSYRSSAKHGRSRSTVHPLPVLLPASADPPQKMQPQFEAGPREWRTPPLWGLCDSAPYLHDGSATTITEAIFSHSGEGTMAALAFQGLSDMEKRSVIDFLESLAAPPMPW